MAKIKDSKKIVSRHYSFYFLGRFEIKVKAMIVAFIFNIVSMMIPFVIGKILKIESTLVNILFPIGCIGIIRVFMFYLKLQGACDKGLYAYERIVAYTAGIKKTIEAGKTDIFLSYVSLYAGIIQLVFVTSVLDAILVILLLALNIVNIYITGIYEEVDRGKKTALMTVLSIVTAIIAVIMKNVGVTALVPAKIGIIAAILFMVVGRWNTKRLLHLLFYHKETPLYVKPYMNYENLDLIAEDVEAAKVRKIKYDRTGQFLRALEKARKEEEEFQKLMQERYIKYLLKKR